MIFPLVVFGSSSMTSTEQNTIAFSIANPTVCISNMAQYYTSKDWLEASQGNDALWGNPLGYERDEDNAYPNKGSKSYYDPCPAGYRVPPADVFRSFTSSGGYTESFDSVDAYDISGDGQIGEEDYNCGWMFNMESGHSFFPAAARYDGSYAMLYGSVSGLWGSYWSNCPSYVTGSGGLGHACLSFSKQARGYTFSPSAGGSKADAHAAYDTVDVESDEQRVGRLAVGEEEELRLHRPEGRYEEEDAGTDERPFPSP